VPNGRPAMLMRSSIYGCSAVLSLSAFFVASALGQAPSSSSASVEQKIEDLRAENAVVLEQLKALVDKVNQLQRRLDGEPASVVRESPSPTPSSTAPTDRDSGCGAGQQPGTDVRSDFASECRVDHPTGGSTISKYFRTA